MSTFSAREKTIGSFFGTYKDNPRKELVIPDLQRDYTWGDDQFQELWDDLNTSYEKTFFGSILVKDQNDTLKKVEIIDGQQRITTITILVQSICFYLENLKYSHFYKNNPAQINEKIIDLQKLYIDRFERETRADGTSIVKNNFYLTVQESVNSYFREYVQKPQDPLIYFDLDPQTHKRPFKDMIDEFLSITSAKRNHRPWFNKGRPCKRMQAAYRFFIGKIRESEAHENLRNEDDELRHQKFFIFLDHLINKLRNFQIVHIQAPGDELAYEYFEAVNARGVNLSVADLLKNLILKNITSKRKLKKAKDIWDEFIEEIRGFDKRENAIGDFFRYYWASEYEYVASKHLYKAIKLTKTRELGDDDDKWLSYTKELLKTATRYRLLLDPNKTQSDFVNYGFSQAVALSIRDSIFGLRASKTRIWTVIMLSLINNSPNKNNFTYFSNENATGFSFKKFTDILARFIFSYSYIVKDRSNRIWSTFCDLSVHLNAAAEESKEKEELRVVMKDYFYSKVRPMVTKKELFIEECIENLVYNPNFSSPVKYALWEVEKNIYNNGDFSRGNTTVEHIVPRDPDQHWGFSLKSCPEIDTIGNLILLEKRRNSSLGNLKYSHKIKKLKNVQSVISQVKSSSDVDGFIKYKSNGNVKENFSNFNDIKLINGKVNVKPIIKRQDFVVNQYYEVFINQLLQKVDGYLR